MDDVQRLRKLRRFQNDIISFGELLSVKLSTISLEDLLADPDLLHASTYRVQCLSEAAKNAIVCDPTIEERHPQIPWHQVRGIGNRLRYEYGDVRTDIILETARGKDARSLVEVAKAELERLAS